MMMVNEVARLAGVSERTLRYYDQMKLLSPAQTSDAGYRLYNQSDLQRLQRILFLRELDFPLKEIGPMLKAEEADQMLAVRRHRTLLLAKKERLQGLIDLCERILEGEDTMSLKEFDESQVDAMRDEYAQEAKQRWGNTEAYQVSSKKAKGYTKQDWDAIKAEQNDIFGAFAELVGSNPIGQEVRTVVERWRNHLDTYFYPCDNQMLKGLGEMYRADERFQATLNSHGAGTSELMSEAFTRIDEA